MQTATSSFMNSTCLLQMHVYISEVNFTTRLSSYSAAQNSCNSSFQDFATDEALMCLRRNPTLPNLLTKLVHPGVQIREYLHMIRNVNLFI